MKKKELTLELTIEEMITFLNFIREDVIVNVTFEEKGGDPDGRREEI